MQPNGSSTLVEREEAKAHPEPIDFGPGTDDLIGGDLLFVTESLAMRAIRSQVERLAPVDVPILILGESGTGKEVLARVLHKLSDRSHLPFVKVNCAALPAGLLESELFGYEAGAFTGAARSKPGKFELCGRGTILLDEIGELPPELQAKLLQVVQDHKFYRLGGNSLVEVKARILAATNVNIEEALAAGRFRQDLYYRLSAFSLHLPPLRTRREDIPLLLHHFMYRFAAQLACPPLPVSTALVSACRNYSWPGNLRELENVVKRYLVLGDERGQIEELQRTDVCIGPESVCPAGARLESGLKSQVRSQKAAIEIEEISRALLMAGFNRTAAARALGISYKSLRMKVKAYGLGRPTVFEAGGTRRDLAVSAIGGRP